MKPKLKEIYETFEFAKLSVESFGAEVTVKPEMIDNVLSLVDEVERLEQDRELSLTHIKEMDFTASGQPAMVFYEMLTQLFEQNGGKNFLTITLEKRDKSGRYSVTIRNLNGEFSEAEKLAKMEKQVEEMQKTLETAKSQIEKTYSVAKAYEGFEFYHTICSALKENPNE